MVAIIVGLAFVALIVSWLLLVPRSAAPHPERQTASYRHRQTENPDWVPGSGRGIF